MSENEYIIYPKTGTYKCQLDFTVWGKSGNLFCFFTNIETGEMYRLSVWFNQNYKPRKGEVSFKDANPETLYIIEIKAGKKGRLPTFVSAKLIDS
jgi:hypothetical protein